MGDRPANDERADDGSEEGPPSRSISWNQGVVVAGLVMSLPWLVFGPAAFGYYLDYLLGTSPWIALIGLVIGVIGSVIDVVVILRRVGLME